MKIIELLKKSDWSFRRNLVLFMLTYFMAIFNYPLIKASTTSMFFDAYGAKASPAAWAWAVLFLSLAITACNRLQKNLSVQTVFYIASLVSAMIFVSGHVGIFSESKMFTYFSFIWKEICVVIQIHLLLGYANNYFRKDDFKILLGLLGASGSLGGIMGGLATTYLSSKYGTFMVLMTGVAFVFIPVFSFFGTEKITTGAGPAQSPLASLDTKDVRRYVIYIAAIVALTQFIINIADFRFNISFEETVQSADLRTGYLGNIYTWTNALTFFFQMIILPYILPRVKEKSLHLFIPLSYVVCLGFLIGGSHMGLALIASVYVFMKASDYSLFSGGKELLYQPLAGRQKYGAKYLTDMLVYRSSKAMIALTLIYLQSSTILNMMMAAFLVLWIVTVTKMFKLHQKLFA